jgi:hypothetical protein
MELFTHLSSKKLCVIRRLKLPIPLKYSKYHENSAPRPSYSGVSVHGVHAVGQSDKLGSHDAAHVAAAVNVAFGFACWTVMVI